MTVTGFDPLEVRRVLGWDAWEGPTPHGPAGFAYVNLPVTKSVIVSEAEFNGTTWVHASMAGLRLPSYVDLFLLHRAVFGDRYAYQVFAPPADHINIHTKALYLWGRADGVPALPLFGAHGTI